MMTNFEYYADKIKVIGLNFGIARSGKFLKCYSFPCVDCAFNCNECSKYKLNWLLEEHEEHKEPSELTYNERMLCEVMNYEYLARNKSGQLVAFKDKPVKGEAIWDSQTYVMLIADRRFKDCKFSFIKWEDKEPWAISDLMKLGVKE